MRRLAEALWWLAAPLGLLAFWCGMVAAAHAYPGGYDWRYQTISVLLYSDRNPHGYFWAWAGLELCGLFGIAWTADRRRGFEGATAGAGSSMRGLRLLRAGFVCICCAVLPDRLLPVPKGHEILAILAFLAICIGVMQRIFLAQHGRRAYRRRRIVARLGASLRAGVPLVPLALAGITQTYLALGRPNVPWVSPSWRTLRIPLYLSFAVWEWVSCAMLSACLLLLWLCRVNDKRDPETSLNLSNSCAPRRI
jgi:hypothetical protein